MCHPANTNLVDLPKNPIGSSSGWTWGGRVPDLEIMIINDAIKSIIRENDSASAIVDSIPLSPGAQTKIQSLAKLVATNKITLQTAEKQIKESDHEALQGTIISYSGNSRR